MVGIGLVQQLRAPLPRVAHPRVKPWVKLLLSHQDAIERAVRGQLGAVLGCGHWGCVVDLVGGPWALKLTIDPTEAHIWKRITDLVAEEGYGGDGFPRIKKIFKFEPGIPYGHRGRSRIAYGIVREKIAPIHTSWGQQTPETLRRISQYPMARQEFEDNIDAIYKYREEASRFHHRPKASEWWYPPESREKIRDRLERIIYRMSGPMGGALGESLNMLLAHDVVLNDVHLGNIGWRVIEEIDGDYAHTGLVIFDPGHTPTAKQQLPHESWIQLMQLG